MVHQTGFELTIGAMTCHAYVEQAASFPVKVNSAE
jgi:hypothetical protein